MDKCTQYAKLILKDDGYYTCEIVTQKIEVDERTFNTQEIYGFDRPKDPYSKEDNLCVVCMTKPRLLKFYFSVFSFFVFCFLLHLLFVCVFFFRSLTFYALIFVCLSVTFLNLT